MNGSSSQSHLFGTLLLKQVPQLPLSIALNNAIPQHAIAGLATGAVTGHSAILNILQNTKAVLISSHSAYTWTIQASAQETTACSSITLTQPYRKHPLQR